MADVQTKKKRTMFLTRGPNYVPGMDIADILQSELDDYRPINIPLSYYNITENITTPYRSGGSLCGAGRTDVLIAADGTYSGLSTRIRCLGNALTGAALTIRGSEFELHNITLLGATTHPTIPPAQAAGSAILISNDSDGGGQNLGAGKHEIDGIGLYGWTTGVQIGEDEAGNSNDHCHFSRMKFRNNTNSVWVKNTQAIGHVFSECEWRHETTYAIRVSAGGHLHVENSLVAHGGLVFFYFDGTSNNGDVVPYENYRVGANARLHKVSNLKVDDQHAGLFKCVETTHSNNACVHFDYLQVSGDDAWSIGNIDDSMGLTFTNCHYKTEPTQFTVSALPFDGRL